MNTFDVRVHTSRRRSNRRRPFEVRWHVGATAKSRSFITRGLADSYRAELVRAASRGMAFDLAGGEPAAWVAPSPPAITWYQHAIGYADIKWAHLAAHSRASLAEALATVTPALTRPAAHRPASRVLRAALYQHAFNPRQRPEALDCAAAGALAWLERASLPIQSLADPHVTRRALDALTLRLDGERAAPNTITRKRAVYHGALGYAVELGLLPDNPLSRVNWTTPRACAATSPLTVASPEQVRAILTEVTGARPDLSAFFGCLYYAALRPEEAVALRRADLILPRHGWGTLILSASCPRTATAWTATGTAHEHRGLKHRPDGAVRVVPIPPELVTLLRCHLDSYGTAPDGRLLRGVRGGFLSKSVYGRAWHTARDAALSPELAATPLARRPYDLRHAALSLWLNATTDPARVARPRREQRLCLARRLHPLRQRLRRRHQPADGARPPRSRPAASAESERSATPLLPSGACPLYVREWPTPRVPRDRRARSKRQPPEATRPCFRSSVHVLLLRAAPGNPPGSGPHLAHDGQERYSEPLALDAKSR